MQKGMVLYSKCGVLGPPSVCIGGYHVEGWVRGMLLCLLGILSSRNFWQACPVAINMLDEDRGTSQICQCLPNQQRNTTYGVVLMSCILLKLKISRTCPPFFQWIHLRLKCVNNIPSTLGDSPQQLDKFTKAYTFISFFHWNKSPQSWCLKIKQCMIL